MENNSIIESLIKSKEEVQAFIDEQKSKYAGTDICQFSAEDIRSFMGKEFMEATHLPQHDYMDIDDATLERAFTYYHDIWLERCKFDEEGVTYDRYAPFVSDRMDFIEKHPGCKIQWLSYLRENKMSKDEFYQNYGITLRRYSKTLRMQLYHSQGDVKPVSNFADVSMLDFMRYNNRISEIVREFINNQYTYNLYMGCGADEPAPMI